MSEVLALIITICSYSYDVQKCERAYIDCVYNLKASGFRGDAKKECENIMSDFVREKILLNRVR